MQVFVMSRGPLHADVTKGTELDNSKGETDTLKAASEDSEKGSTVEKLKFSRAKELHSPHWG